MIKTYTKRTLALVLTVVMLVSCWVFTAPVQSTAATAGNYYVEIDVYIDRSATFNRSYVGPNFTTSNDNGWKDQGGITLYYKDNNGTDTQEKYVSYGFGNKDTVPLKGNDGTITTAQHNIIGSTGTKIIADTITGFPTSFATYVMNDHFTEYAEYHISKLSIAPADDHSKLTTLWEGSCKVSNCGKGALSSGTARYIVNYDGTANVWAPSGVSSTNFWTTDNNFVYCPAYNRGNPANELEYLEGSQTGSTYNQITNATVGANAATYCRAWAMPTPTTITDISGASSVAVNTDGTTTNTESYTLGTVKDQYGVDWYQDASWDTATTQNGVTFSNGTLSVPASSNRSSDYTVTLNETFGDLSKTKEVAIGTFDYNVTFYDEDGETPLITQNNIDYGASATAPAATKSSDATYHYNLGWTGDSFETITSGAQSRTTVATYTAEEHDLGEPDIASQPTCTDAGKGTATCRTCSYAKVVSIPALGHDPQVTAVAPKDGLRNAGHVYFQCSRCEVSGQQKAMTKIQENMSLTKQKNMKILLQWKKH